MIPSAWSLQIALYDRLRNDVDLQNWFGGVVRLHDAVPPDAVFPFITIGESRMQDYGGVDNAREHDIRIHAYSRWGGRKELRELTDLISASLHDADFPVSGVKLAQCRFVFADIFRQADPDTFHAVIRFRLVTEPLAVTV